MSDSKKTQLPELLPTPPPENQSDPKERVNERARQLLARFRDLGVTGMAILGLQCGDGRIGQTPGRNGAAAGSGGAGVGGTRGEGGGGGGVTRDARGGGEEFGAAGSGGGGPDGPGYVVVDPAPPPAYFECTTFDDPFETLKASATALEPSRLYLYLSGGVLSLRVDAVRVTGGTLVSTDDRNASNRYNPYLIVILEPAAQPSILIVEVDLGCGSDKTTKKYQITLGAVGAGVRLNVVELRP